MFRNNILLPNSKFFQAKCLLICLECAIEAKDSIQLLLTNIKKVFFLPSFPGKCLPI